LTVPLQLPDGTPGPTRLVFQTEGVLKIVWTEAAVAGAVVMAVLMAVGVSEASAVAVAVGLGVTLGSAVAVLVGRGVVVGAAVGAGSVGAGEFVAVAACVAGG
jgi:hypothetical protein